jgi:transcriptional regulator with XRE-family HTH domain
LILITSNQIRAARALTEMTVRDLAERSQIAFSTLVRLESAGNEVPAGNIKTIDAVKKTFEELGIEFIGNPESQAGVRWRR